MKASQKKMKEQRSNPEVVMKLQKEVMKTNMTYMKHSLKSTLFTFIPIILIFSWMTGNFAFDPILPGQEFETRIVFQEGNSGSVRLQVPEEVTIIDGRQKEIEDNQVSWILSSDEGEYLLDYIYNSKTYSTAVLVTEENRYIEPIKIFKDSVVDQIEVVHQKKIIFNLFGWKMGWLASYILLAILFSILIRKVVKVY